MEVLLQKAITFIRILKL